MPARPSKSKAKRSAPDAMIATGIRVPRETKETLDAIAEEEGRSFSNLVQRALDEWLKTKGWK
jgi:predicted transcriptional regulator